MNTDRLNCVPTLIRVRQFDNAISLLDAYLNDVSAEADVVPKFLVYRGVAHYFKSEFALAVTDYRSALRQKPNYVVANVNLSHIYACCPDDVHHNATDAIFFARRACSLSRWKHWLAVQALVAAYLRAGDFASATAYIERSSDLATESHQLLRVAVLKQCVVDRIPFTTSIDADLRKLDTDVYVKWPANHRLHPSTGG